MNTILAIESSSATPSAALMRGDALLGMRTWNAARGASQRMLEAIHALLADNGVSLDEVSCFGIGLGPGGFTGLRISLSAVQSLALPTRTDVFGVSSAEATAAQVKLDHSTNGRILVVGEARRKRLWVGVFETEHGSIKRQGDFELVPIDDFRERLVNGDTVATPDWDSLGDALLQQVPTEATLIEQPIPASAPIIAQLVAVRKSRGIPGDALEPVYMHPPVFVEPRFTEPSKRLL